MKFVVFPGAISRCEIAPGSSLRRFVKEALFAASFIAVVVAGTANTNANLVATVTVGVNPNGLAVNSTGSAVYVANSGSNTVSVINAAHSVIATIAVGNTPMFVALTRDDTTAFVTNNKDNTVSVISTATNTVVDTIPVGLAPWGLAVQPFGSQLWVCNRGTGNNDGTVSVIDVPTRKTIRTIPIPVGQSPLYVLLSSGSKAHVLNQGDLAPTGTHVQGYLTQIDSVTGRILAERTFTQENTEPLGMAFSPRRQAEIYISCMPAESSLVRIGYQGTLITPVYDKGPNFRNSGSYIGGIASAGTHYKRSYLFIANTGVNTLVRKTQKVDGRGASRSIHLGDKNKPLFVAVGAAGLVYVSNPNSGTVSIVDTSNIPK